VEGNLTTDLRDGTKEATPVLLEERIAAAFNDKAGSSDVARLITEVEALAGSSGEAEERAHERALDPALSAADVAAARRDMEDAAFRRERLQTAVTRLRERLVEVRAEEEDNRRRLAYEKAKAERDKLAAELKSMYPPIAAQLPELLARIAENDREIEHINASALPSGAERLLVAELVARRLSGFVENWVNIPRITTQLRLPAFQYSGQSLYAWPRQER
jgi:hypothetical protein